MEDDVYNWNLQAKINVIQLELSGYNHRLLYMGIGVVSGRHCKICNEVLRCRGICNTAGLYGRGLRHQGLGATAASAPHIDAPHGYRW